MTPRRRLAGIGAFTLASALLLSACGGGSGEDPEATEDTGASTGIVTVSNGEPQNPLIPTMTNETNGSQVITSLFAGLVYYDADGVPQNEMAESIESDDNQTWTITIKDGWQFTDGTPVTAQSYVDAWNYGAKLSNAQNLSYFFEPIEGFSYEKDSELTGLTVVSDTEFTVQLTQPESDFPLRLGYSAFMPLPEAFFEDPEALGEAPVGNGPYMLDEWVHNEQISLVPNPDYQGGREVQNGGVDLIAYTEENTAYNDLLGGDLDIVKNVPSSSFATFETDLGERAVNQPAAVIQVINVPEYLKEFQGEAGTMRRAAISMAIDRETITDTLYNGTRTPAKDFSSPVITGWTEEVPGNEVLTYDAAGAKAMWDEAESMDPVGADFTLFIASNADSDHQPWVDAVCNNVRDALGIDCEFDPYATFDEFLDARDNESLKGLFRGGWQADYPAMSNFLGPIYGTGAGSNDMGYSNKEFDAKMTEGNGAATPEEATASYIEAQSILFEDVPGIPLWYQNATGGYAETVDNVVFGWDSDPLLYQVTKSE
ncbi:ABC transporter substrate-binding protein [Isoptericola hypogeus]|uniref:peptide ABC transporter substrate-binding protein n=1 Tax=Isoptericola hypogeus TaxID=300179 RepID=UPI0031D7C27C